MKLEASFVVVGFSLIGTGVALPVDTDHQTILTNDYSLFSTIRDVLIDNKVIGDVLDDFNPDYYLDINYPKHHQPVLLGNDIPVDYVADRPVFTFKSLNPLKPPLTSAENTTFTLALTDPDAKSRDNPKWSEMCHWIITNLTTTIPELSADPDSNPDLELESDWPEAFKAKPGELESYLPPGPPPKTGPHRYVFVLLQGNSSTPQSPKDREHWGYGKVRHGVRDWAKENNLTVVGANFFFAQNEKQ